MVTQGRCPYCGAEEIKRNEHHIIPQRFTRKNGRRDVRLDILFPEFFGRGNRETIDICLKCHVKVDRFLLSLPMMAPDKYWLFHQKILSKEPIISNLVKSWVEESLLEIKKRQKRMIEIEKEYQVILWFLKAYLCLKK